MVTLDKVLNLTEVKSETNLYVGHSPQYIVNLDTLLHRSFHSLRLHSKLNHYQTIHLRCHLPFQVHLLCSYTAGELKSHLSIERPINGLSLLMVNQTMVMTH